MSFVAGLLKRRGSSHRTVMRSEEFRRIEELPRRLTYADLREFFNIWLRKPGSTEELRIEQAWALAEAYDVKGLVGALPTGFGKGLLSLLLPIVLGARRPLLVLPASLRDQLTSKVIPRWEPHFQMHPNLKVISYEQLSTAKNADVLQKLMPDLIVGDEVQRIANTKNAAWRRIERYSDEYPVQKVFDDSTGAVIEEHPTMYCWLSGSITKRSIRNYSHLLLLALGNGCPVPTKWTDLVDWADCLDEGVDEDNRPDPGALSLLCDHSKGETIRDGFRRRLVETKGFISVENPEVEASLIIDPRREIEVPQIIVEAFRKMRESGARADGEILATGLDRASNAKELACGFYYRWKWENDVIDYEWLEARKMWRQFVRQAIKASGTARVGGLNFDTELQVANAVRAGHILCPKDEYAKWVAIRDRSSPMTEPVWLSEFLVDHIEKWCKEENKGDLRGICWVDHKAVLDKCRERGLLVYGAGEDNIIDETRTCVASIKAHGTGKDLYNHNNNLFISIPTLGVHWEQTLSRTHRSSQKSDEVRAELLLHCAELVSAFMQALRDADYIKKTMGQTQRLQSADLLADYVDLETKLTNKANQRPLNPLWVVDWPE